MNPIIKYPGGKRNEIKYFEKYIPNEYIRYVEPFVGGGAVFFHLEPKKALINDLNENLIDFYKSLSSNSNKIIKELKEMKNEEDFFYTIRDMFNSKIEPKYSKASMFFYLNKTAYSGMAKPLCTQECILERLKELKTADELFPHSTTINLYGECDEKHMALYESFARDNEAEYGKIQINRIGGKYNGNN